MLCRAMSTDILARCRNFRNVWKKHGPSPWIPLPAPFTFPVQQRGERVGRGAMLIPTCQDLWTNYQLPITSDKSKRGRCQWRVHHDMAVTHHLVGATNRM